MAWTLDVSRTCDKFWFGVTTDKDLDCNDWIGDHDATYMISEEGTSLFKDCLTHRASWIFVVSVAILSLAFGVSNCGHAPGGRLPACGRQRLHLRMPKLRPAARMRSSSVSTCRS